MVRQIVVKDGYRDRLVKLIPAEIVAAYLALQPSLVDLGDAVIVVVIAALFVLTFFYLRQLGGVKNLFQLGFSSISFLIWVYSIAPEPILKVLYNPPLASVVLVMWTLLVPFFFKGGDSSVATS